MSSFLHALISRASGARVAVATALALAATSAVVITAATASVAPTETIWGTSAPSSAVVDSDTGSVELGTHFTAVKAGQATGVRFYKTAENGGTHVGSIWTATGSLLGRVTFSGETASGWETATFASPVALTAGTSYVVSYHASAGRYVSTQWFSGTSVSTDLKVASSGAGVYSYGSGSVFPTQSWNASQYWVDLTFSPATSPLTVSSGTPTASGSTTTPSASGSSSTAVPTTSSPSATAASTSASPTTSGSTTSSTPTVSITTSTPTMSAVSTTTATSQTTKASTITPTGSTASSSVATGSSAGMTNCVSLPSRCGYPDATNSGVPAGTSLLRVPQDVTSGPGWVWDSRGWLQASSGAVVQNLIVDGSIMVGGSNITVKNNVIPLGGETWGVGLQHATNAVVSNNTIGVVGASPRLLVGVKDIYGDSNGTQVVANNIANTSTGVQVYGGVIADNYIHDMGYASGDHINGTTSNGSTTMLTIRHNTVLNKFNQTDAISLFQDFGIEANRLITNNLVAGGGYTIYGGDNERYGKTSNIQITNNRFSTLYYPNGGSYGPVAAFDSSGVGNLASGNYWDTNLSAVNA